MKPFDIEKAKAGHSVCTENGDDVEILTFDRKAPDGKCIVALVGTYKVPHLFNTDGEGGQLSAPLRMKTVKKEGWVNLYKNDNNDTFGCKVFDSEDDAIKLAELAASSCVARVKIEWEE